MLPEPLKDISQRKARAQNDAHDVPPMAGLLFQVRHEYDSDAKHNATSFRRPPVGELLRHPAKIP
jgi:hypothetical protein